MLGLQYNMNVCDLSHGKLYKFLMRSKSIARRASHIIKNGHVNIQMGSGTMCSG